MIILSSLRKSTIYKSHFSRIDNYLDNRRLFLIARWISANFLLNKSHYLKKKKIMLICYGQVLKNCINNIGLTRLIYSAKNTKMWSSLVIQTANSPNKSTIWYSRSTLRKKYSEIIINILMSRAILLINRKTVLVCGTGSMRKRKRWQSELRLS